MGALVALSAPTGMVMTAPLLSVITNGVPSGPLLTVAV